jgi:hypothetical protein
MNICGPKAEFTKIMHIHDFPALPMRFLLNYLRSKERTQPFFSFQASVLSVHTRPQLLVVNHIRALQDRMRGNAEDSGDISVL